jgi:hypothetical protein
VVASEEEVNVAIVVEAEVWWKRSERSGSVDSRLRDFRMAIVPPRTGREDSVPHIFVLCLVLSMECDVDMTIEFA